MNLKSIRNYLTFKKGTKIIVIYNGARNKRERYQGIIDRTYCNVFTIILSNGKIKSFNYIDVLTRTIQIYV